MLPYEDDSSYTAVWLTFICTIETGSLWLGAYSEKSQMLYDMIVELKAQGLGYRRIAHRLNERGVTTTRGHTVWSSGSVYSVLKKGGARRSRLQAAPVSTYSNWAVEYMERVLV